MTNKRNQIKDKTADQLWARAAGRCEFEGCNCVLDADPVTQDAENAGQIAHIVAVKDNWSRGNQLPVHLRDNVENLMLLCYRHHRLVDVERPNDFTVEQLNTMKYKHEERIRMVSGIQPDKQSCIILFGPNDGNDTIVIRKDEAAHTLFPDYYPAECSPIRMELKNSSFKDRDELYWKIEQENVKKIFDSKILPKLEDGLNHFSVFALAPQPLLVYLGTLLNDKYHVSVYQKHREPDSWKWQFECEKNEFLVKRPEFVGKQPVLVFALSATYIEKRIMGLYDDASVWAITCENPNNDMLKTRNKLSEFRCIVRKIIDEISGSSSHGIINIHMAMPISCAFELGRIRMPKADKEWALFDYQQAEGKEVETLHIK